MCSSCEECVQVVMSVQVVGNVFRLSGTCSGCQERVQVVRNVFGL